MVSLSEFEVVYRSLVFAVTCQQLVAALPGQHNLDVTSRELRNEIEGHAGWMSKGLIFVIDQRGQSREEETRADHHFEMPGSERACDQPGISQFVCTSLFKSYGECLEALRHHFAHDRSNGGRIYSTREKHPDRNIRHEPQPHRLFKQIVEL